MHDLPEWSGRLLFALVAVHVLAVVQHAFIKKDGVWQRMWPGRWQAATCSLSLDRRRAQSRPILARPAAVREAVCWRQEIGGSWLDALSGWSTACRSGQLLA
jgi:hypothetical protein